MVAKQFRVRPSQLLRGDLWEYQIDVIIGAEAMRIQKEEFKLFLSQSKGLGGAISAAAHAAFKAVP